MAVAASGVKKETIMRRKDFSGAKEWMVDVELIRSRIVCRLGAEKISRERRFVIRSVLEGGVGWMRGGTLLKSKDKGVRVPDERRD